METNDDYFSPAPWKLEKGSFGWKVIDAEGDVIATVGREKDAKLMVRAMDGFERANTLQYLLARRRDYLEDADRKAIDETRADMEAVGLSPSDMDDIWLDPRDLIEGVNPINVGKMNHPTRRFTE